MKEIIITEKVVKDLKEKEELLHGGAIGANCSCEM
ncbi:hypothetical protein C815_02086 [Firmicutes bacterium M10-2]|nr:hypothetical protein C815_02086 [Firmicutes bacterium M10-2]